MAERAGFGNGSSFRARRRCVSRGPSGCPQRTKTVLGVHTVTTTLKAILFVVLASLSLPTLADPRDLVPAVAALETAVATLQSQVATLQTTNTSLTAQVGTLNTQVSNLQTANSSLTAQVNAIKANSVFGLNGVFALNGTTATFTGVNVQIIDGTGATASTSGLGNLIVGYNDNLDPECAKVGAITRTGALNLVVGDDHSWMSYGGLVAGYCNRITGASASVSGGSSNSASGGNSSVSGGFQNTASGNYSSVSGGNGVSLSTANEWAAGSITSP